MNRLHQFHSRLYRRLIAFLRRRRLQREMEEEMRFHLEMQNEQNLAAGMAPAEAQYAAQRQFGNQTWLKEASREMWSLYWIETLLQDVRYGVRMLRKNPGFTAAAVLTLALGIGANTAIFSVVNAVLLRSLPYNDADRLVSVAEYTAASEGSISYPNFADWREQNKVFEKIGVYREQDYTMTGDGEAERLHAAQMSVEIFSALGVGAALGRVYVPEEDKPGASPVVVLSHALWRRRFGGARNILGRTLTLDDRGYTVVGVMPPGFSFPPRVELWVPVGPFSDLELWKLRVNHPGLYGAARLKPGVTIEQARADLKNIAAALEKQYPDSNQGVGVAVNPLRENYVKDIRRTLYILMSAVGFVLLIASANVANLTLARAAARQKETAVRAALGASRWRITRQWLTESLLLASAGGGLGLLIAYWSVKYIPAISPEGAITRLAEINLDLRVLFFTAAASMLTGFVFGLAPALQSSRSDVQATLKETTRNASAQRGWIRSGLVVTEIALTLVLLVGAGLLIRSFARLQQVNPGFDIENRLLFKISLPDQQYPDSELNKRIHFFTQVREKMAALPGVQSVGLSSGLPLGQNDWSIIFTLLGRPEPPLSETPSMESCIADVGYFEALGIPLVRGRYFNEQDDRSHLNPEKLEGKVGVQRLVAGLNTIIIDEEFARRHFPGEDPIGKQIRLGRSNDPFTTIMSVVGVVGRVKMEGLRMNSDRVQAYFPFRQLASPNMRFTVRTRLMPESLLASVRRQVQEVDPKQALFDISTLEEVRAESIAADRLNLTLLGVFAAIALALALVGIYSVVSWSAAQRTHEIGVRMALGARARDVLRLVVGHGMKIVAIGVGLGIAGAFALTRLMKALLFEVSATDPATFISIVLLLAGAALLASYLPARRASKLDPMTSLRAE